MRIKQETLKSNVSVKLTVALIFLINLILLFPFYILDKNLKRFLEKQATVNSVGVLHCVPKRRGDTER